jgi:hypothetical protein
VTRAGGGIVKGFFGEKRIKKGDIKWYLKDYASRCINSLFLLSFQ